MKKAAIILLTALAALYSLPAAAGSLWDTSSDSLFSDKKALYVGDIVTILVSERTSATQNANTEVDQSVAMEGTTGTGILGRFFENFGVEANDSYKTDGATKSGSTLSTTISAEVMEVLPNGNLLVEARRSMVVNAETQTMVLTGVIRPADVTRDNMVSSAKISNLNVRYEGKGPISKRQKPGILNKIFDMIF